MSRARARCCRTGAFWRWPAASSSAACTSPSSPPTCPISPGRLQSALNVAGDTLAIIGALNIAGTILFGAWGGRRHPPQLLMLDLSVPRRAGDGDGGHPAQQHAALRLRRDHRGILWLSTVPLTSQAVALYFGQKRQAFVFGMVLAAHQVGAFLGAWGGGVVYQLTGSYDLLWISSGIFGLLAALVHWPVRREPKRMVQPQLASSRATASDSQISDPHLHNDTAPIGEPDGGCAVWGCVVWARARRSTLEGVDIADLQQPRQLIQRRQCFSSASCGSARSAGVRLSR